MRVSEVQFLAHGLVIFSVRLSYVLHLLRTTTWVVIGLEATKKLICLFRGVVADLSSLVLSA